MGTYVSQRLGQFAYFDAQLDHPDWTGKRVFDFGGNVGNILLDRDCRIEPHNYWSLDISRDAIEEGRHRHPEANFVFYDRYHPEFNPTGTPNLPIPDLGRFDYIVAWSVITHMSPGESLAFVADLRRLLVPGGTVALTFIDPFWSPPPGWARYHEAPDRNNLRWRLEACRMTSQYVDVEGQADLAEQADRTWLTLVGDTLYLEPDDEALREERPNQQYVSMCTAEHIRTLVPDGEIRPPVQPDRLHCLLVRG